MIYYVYEIRNVVNGKIYVGVHKSESMNDDYMGSGTLLRNAIKKYGKENFTKRILYVYDNVYDALQCERKIVNEDFINREDTYNLVLGGNTAPTKTHTKTLVSKITDSTKITNGIELFSYKDVCKIFGMTKSKRSIILICGDSNNSFFFVDDELQKEVETEYVANGDNFRKLHEEQSKMATERFTNFKWSKSRNEKISKTLKGRPSPHTILTNKNKEKIRKTAEKHRGMKRSEDAKHKMSLAKLGKPANNKGLLMAYDKNGKRHYLPKDTILEEGWRWSPNALKTLKS